MEEYLYNVPDWMPPAEWRKKPQGKYRGYQNVGHQEKVKAARRKKNKAAKKARRANRK